MPWGPHTDKEKPITAELDTQGSGVWRPAALPWAPHTKGSLDDLEVEVTKLQAVADNMGGDMEKYLDGGGQHGARGCVTSPVSAPISTQASKSDKKDEKELVAATEAVGATGLFSTGSGDSVVTRRPNGGEVEKDADETEAEKEVQKDDGFQTPTGRPPDKRKPKRANQAERRRRRQSHEKEAKFA